MSELISIWGAKDLEGAPPPPFSIPNNVNARTLKINNQSRFWLYITKTSTSVQLDRIEPFSYLIFPFEPDLSLSIDTSGDAAPVSSLAPDIQFVDYSTISGAISYAKGSTQFNGSSSVTINGSVNISNSTLDVAIMGTPTFNLAPNTTVGISNSYLNVSITGTPTFNLAAGTQVSISGTPTMNIGSMPAVTFASGSKVEISGSPTMNIGSMPSVTIGNAVLEVSLNGTNTVNIGSMPNVTISNSSLNVAITGTPTFNLGTGATVAITGTPTMNIGTMPSVTFASGSKVEISGTPTIDIGSMPSVTFAAGSSVSITGTPTMNIGSMPSVTIGNAVIDVTLTGTNTVNIGSMPNVTISNSSLNVAITGTPTFNLGTGATVAITGTPTMNIGSMPSVTFAAGSSVSITGTPTMNIGTMPSVTFAAGSSVSITGTPTMNIGSMPAVTFAAGSSVTINGTPTMNIGSMPNVTVQSGTIEVSAANATIVNEQLPTTQIYNSYQSQQVAAGTKTITLDLQYLPNGNMVELHRGVIFLSSNIGTPWVVSSLTAKATFADGTTYTAPSHFTVSQDPQTGAWMYGGAACVSNIFEITLTTATAPATVDTLSIHYQIDANDTAIDVRPGSGVPIQTASTSLIDASGTITTANTSQSVIGLDPSGQRKYILFQNLSSSDMYINFGSAASGGAGSILVQKSGGGISFETTLCPPDALNVFCTTAGAAFTCKYC